MPEHFQTSAWRHGNGIGRSMDFPNLEPIDGVFNYCDRWCEKCPFTTRCSLFAIDVATAMCDGDVKAGLELAIGLPPPMNANEERRRAELIDEMNSCVPTASEVASYRREEEARRQRIEETSVFTALIRTQALMDAWLDAHDRLDVSGDKAASTALETIRWDRYLIPAKLRRALHGADEQTRGESIWEDPMQSDWNGTAKLTLICIERSIHAWNVLAEQLGDAEAMQVRDELEVLRQEVADIFPHTRHFVRPGFDRD